MYTLKVDRKQIFHFWPKPKVSAKTKNSLKMKCHFQPKAETKIECDGIQSKTRMRTTTRTTSRRTAVSRNIHRAVYNVITH